MRVFLRVALLGSCAALGVTLAFALIRHAAPATDGHEQTSRYGSTADAPPPPPAGPAGLPSASQPSNGFGPSAQGFSARSAHSTQPSSARSAAARSVTAGLDEAAGSATPAGADPWRGSSADSAGQAKRSAEAMAAQWAALAPMWATVHGSMASQMLPLTERLARAQDELQENQRSLLDILTEFRRQQQETREAAGVGSSQDVANPSTPAAQPSTAGGVAPGVLESIPPPSVRGPGSPGGVLAGSVPMIRDEGDNRLSINIQKSDIRDVLELLSRQADLNILASPNVNGTVSATLNDVDILTALDAILRSTGYQARQEGDFIFVGTPKDFELMAFSRQKLVTRVFRPNYVSAAELQTLITPLLTPDLGEATLGAGQISLTTRPQVGIQADNTGAGGDDYAGSDVLLVRDYESVIEQVEQIVFEVDQKPRQVSIEAIIIGVRLDDSNTLGVNFELLRNKDNARLISGSPLNNLATLNLDDGGLKFGFLDSSLAVFIEALESIGDTNVVASPRLMCLNKQRAEILIGSQLGYVSTTVTENAATQAVEFLEVGTQLRLRPFISSDDMIRLEVHPELSTGSVRVEQGLTLPDKEVTQVTTNIMCRDGCTIVIGGLIREDLGTTATQIPWLGSMPLVGPVFRQKTETIDRRELIVLLTPRIVHDPLMCVEGDTAAADFARRQEIYADKMSPLGKRHIGTKYFRLASSAWAAGDVQAAFRYVNLAIHFDPQNIESTNLRGDIVAAYPQLDIPLHRRLRTGLPPWERPHRNYTRQGVPWRPEPGAGIPEPGSEPHLEPVLETIVDPGIHE